MASSAKTKRYYDNTSFVDLLQGCQALTKGNLSLFHLNARSMRNKSDEIDVYLGSLDFRFDVLAFTETWYTSRSDVVNFDGYKYEGRYRENKRGGGIALYFRNNIAFDVMPELSVLNTHCESLVVKCCGTVIVLVYRPPSGSINDFLLYMDDLIDRISFLNLPMVVIGDMNIDLLCSSPACRQFLDVIESYNCKNVIDVPTRITQETETLIDLCVISSQVNNVISGVLSCDLSHHLPIFCVLPCSTSRKCPKTEMLYRSINNEKINSFCLLMSDINWDDVYHEQNPSQVYDIFLQKLLDCYCTYHFRC